MIRRFVSGVGVSISRHDGVFSSTSAQRGSRRFRPAQEIESVSRSPTSAWVTSSPAHGSVSDYVFDKARISSARAVDFDSGVEPFGGACALARCRQCAAPVLKGIGFLPRQTVALEGRDRFLKLVLCRHVVALRRSHNRLGARDSAASPNQFSTAPTIWRQRSRRNNGSPVSPASATIVASGRVINSKSRSPWRIPRASAAEVARPARAVR
jgi:hypothetical protein